MKLLAFEFLILYNSIKLNSILFSCRRLRSVYDPKLDTFFSVVKNGSFTKAATELYMTPSAVLHQISTLEKELGVSLFYRTPRGVSLTKEGVYLENHAQVMLQMDAEIRRGIRAVSTEEDGICIGTSMLEKCRLLYDLWILFSEEEKGCRIEMVNIDIDISHEIPEQTDLIEGINSEVPWMLEWNFLEICKVPFGCAFAKNHPLSKKERVSFYDLSGETIRTLNGGSCEAIASLLNQLRKSGANVVINHGEGINMLWESAFTGDVLLVPTCFHDILINTVVVPFEQETLLPYGVFYRHHPKSSVRRFLDFIDNTYGQGNPSGIVPVLT